MPDVSNSGLTLADVLASLPTSFVGNGDYMPVATLLSTYPAGAPNLGKYARVNDLWGSVRSVMVCEYDGTSYYWRPQRTDYATANSSTGGTVTLTPLLTSPTMILTGTLGLGMTVTPSSTNAWPGAQFEVISNGLLGIFSININGLLGGALPLLAGGRRILTFTAAGWRGA